MKMQSTLRNTTGSATPSSVSSVEELRPTIKQIYRRYKDGCVGMLADMAMNSYDPITCLHPQETIMINEIFYKANSLVVRFREEHFGICEDFYKTQYTFLKDTGCVCDYPSSPHYSYTFPNIGCPDRIYHAKAHIIAYIKAWMELTNIKSRRKHYRKLIKSVLSLEEEVFAFTPDIIIRYDQFKNVNIVEYLFNKYRSTHLVVEQCGPSQSRLADCYDKILEIFTPLSNKFSLEEMLMPRQQSWFTLKHEHEHKVNEEAFTSLRASLVEAQSSFFDGMRDTLLSTAKNLSIMFLTASTVALLTKLSLGIAADVIFKLLHFIYSFVTGSEYQPQVIESYKAVQQSALENKVTIPFLPAMILEKIISPPKDILKIIWNSPDIDRVMRRIGYLGDIKIERGLERIVDWIKGIFKEVKNWYRINILGLEQEPDLDAPNHELVTWNESVDMLIESYYKGDFSWTDTNWSVTMSLYSTGLRLARSQLYVRYKADIWKVLNRLHTILQEFKQHSRSGSKIRNPPVTIYLTGDTGVGKSSLTYPLAVEVLRDIFAVEKPSVDLKKTWKNLIYMRAAEQEYWDGYENQFVTIFDDFSQLVDSAANPNLELFEIIRASNCFPYPLHMASLDQKATTEFSSNIIIVSSNLSKPDTHSLNFPAALQRRFDIAVKVKRNEMGQKISGNEFSPDIYQFTQYDMVTGAEIRNITYTQLIELCTAKYFSRKDFVKSMQDYIEDKALNKAVQQGGDDPLKVHFGIDMATDPPFEGPPGSLNGRIVDGATCARHRYIKNAFETEFGDREIPCARFDKKNPFFMEGALARMHSPNLAYQVSSGINMLELDSIPIHIPYSPWQKAKYYATEITGCFTNNMWTALKASTAAIKIKYAELQEAWLSFKKKHSYWAKVAITVSIVFAGLMFLKMFTSVKKMIQPPKQNFITPEAFEESYGSVAAPVAKVESYSAPNVAIAKKESALNMRENIVKAESELVKEQGVKDLNAAEILMKVARHNVYKMYETSTDTAIGHVLFVVGRIAVMPKHYLSMLKQALKLNPDATVWFEATVLRRSFECKITDILKTTYSHESPDEDGTPVYTRDIMAVVVPTAIVHTNAVPYFVTRNDVSRVDATDVMLPVLVNNQLSNSDRSILMIRFSQGKSQLKREERLAVHNEELKLARYVRDAWSYNMDTQASECGAPLIIRNTMIRPGKICGLHIAGIEGTGQGFSTPLYQEDLNEILDHFPIEYRFNQKIRLSMGDFPVEQGQVPKVAEFIRLGKLENPLPQPGKTNIRPSLAHASYKQPETKPCCLTKTTINDEDFDPRVYRLERLGNIPVCQNTDMINASRDACLDEISQVISETKENNNANLKAVYSFEEACLGIDGEDYINAVKRDTSPGFPFVTNKQMKDRKQFFGNGMEYDLTSPQCQELKKRVLHIIEEAKQGQVLDHYFMDTLKDERKPIHKAHKTRLFAAGPLDYLIACKMYFNGVVALLQKNRNWCHVSVGTNPDRKSVV